jgi:hypothetical protein
MSVVDGVLEDIIPEDFLLKLSEIRVIDVRIDHPNEVSSTSLLAGPEVNLSVCHGTSAPEGPSGPKGALAPKVASMGVHVGSPMPQTDDVVVTSSVVPIGPADQTTLEVRCSSTKNLMGVSSAEFPMGVSSVEIPMGVSGAEIPMSVTLSLGDRILQRLYLLKPGLLLMSLPLGAP